MDMKELLDELIIRPLEIQADARERGLVARDGEVEITIEAFEPNTVADTELTLFVKAGRENIKRGGVPLQRLVIWSSGATTTTAACSS